MSPDQFEILYRQIGAFWKQEAPERIVSSEPHASPGTSEGRHGGRFAALVSGIEVLVVHGSPLNADVAFAIVELDHAPSRDDVASCKDLLKLNFDLLGVVRNCVVSCDWANRKVKATMEIPLGSSSAAEVCAHMELLAAAAIAWRGTEERS